MPTPQGNRPASRFRPILAVLIVAGVAAGAATFANAASSVLDGRFVFWRTSKLTTPISGRIASLPKRIGDQVKEGEIVATIDARQLKADLAIAQQALISAKAELANAEAVLNQQIAEHKRFARLKNSPAYSGARFEDTKNGVAVAQSNVEARRAVIKQREAEVARREIDVQFTNVKAPFDGIIAEHLLTVGSLVSQENPDVLLLIDNKTPEIEASVPVAQVSSLAVGSEVEFSFDKSKRQRAKVRAVLPAKNPSAKDRLVRLIIVDPTGSYPDTAAVKIYLPGS